MTTAKSKMKSLSGTMEIRKFLDGKNGIYGVSSFLQTGRKRPEEKRDLQPYPFSSFGLRLDNQADSVESFSAWIIGRLDDSGQERLAEAYSSSVRKFFKFVGNRKIRLSDMDADMMVAYEAFLRTEGISANTSSFYMRNLRAIYNRAVEKGIIGQAFPFRSVYTGTGKTVKRAIGIPEIKRIMTMDLSHCESASFARDMFLFSFYTRGMAFVDMAFLKKKDLKGTVLSYRRKKTGQQLTIRWEGKMQEIVDRYETGTSPYLLPIIDSPGGNERRQYLNASYRITRALKKIGKELELEIPLTLYVSRHSWASIAKSKNIPVSVISDGMGHDSESTTLIYLASLDNSAVDKANKAILDSLA